MCVHVHVTCDDRSSMVASSVSCTVTDLTPPRMTFFAVKRAGTLHHDMVQGAVHKPLHTCMVCTPHNSQLTNLHSQSSHPRNENTALPHLLHSLMAKNVPTEDTV